MMAWLRIFLAALVVTGAAAVLLPDARGFPLALWDLLRAAVHSVQAGAVGGIPSLMMLDAGGNLQWDAAYQPLRDAVGTKCSWADLCTILSRFALDSAGGTDVFVTAAGQPHVERVRVVPVDYWHILVALATLSLGGAPSAADVLARLASSGIYAAGGAFAASGRCAATPSPCTTWRRSCSA